MSEERDIQLTAEQEKILIETWNKTPDKPPTFAVLSLAVWGKEHRGNDRFGRAIKQCLAKHSLKMAPTVYYEPKVDSIVLTDEHKAYIQNNASMMQAVDMARIIFGRPELTNLHAETKAVAIYAKELNLSIVYEGAGPSDVPVDEYRPPKTFDQTLKRVNFYLNDALVKDKMTQRQKRDLEVLQNYLHNRRVIKQLNRYDSMDDRTTFEDVFIRYTYNKPDLTQEEVDQVAMLAHEVVTSFKIQGRINKLQRLLDGMADGGDNENVKLSMSLVEAISSAQKEFDDCASRYQKLNNDLNGKRSTRLAKAESSTSSVLAFFNAWKEEETRKDIIDIGKREQEVISDNVRELADMDDFRAKILGLTKDEILHG